MRVRDQANSHVRVPPAGDALMLNVRVLFFASLREHLGKAELVTRIPSTLTAASLWQRLSAGNDALPEQVLFAVNHEYVNANYRLNDGDTIAFFPPVTGG